MKISPEKLDELIKIIHLAGIEIIKIYKKKVTKRYKSDNTPVTNADIRANDIICKGLKRHFPDHRVHTVNFPGDPYPIHIDATFTPIRPGLILNNPVRKLPKEQRKLFKDNGWEIIEAAQPAHNSPPPLTYYSIWLSMNILVLDPKTVCVEKSEVYQAEQLDKLGMEVLPVDFREAYGFGGSLHCSTTDVYREGSLQDYFPKQE